ATTGTFQTASPIAVAPAPLVVYYARQGLPPFRATALGGVPSRNSVEDRIGARLSALWGAQPRFVPPDMSNPFAKSGRVGSQGQLGTGVRIDGDVATVTFDLPGGWGVTSASESQGLYQQLVYTITEDPEIRRALIREKGKAEAVIGTLVIAEPATREDVAGYTFSGTKTPTIVEARFALYARPSSKAARSRLPSALTTRGRGVSRSSRRERIRHACTSTSEACPPT